MSGGCARACWISGAVLASHWYVGMHDLDGCAFVHRISSRETASHRTDGLQVRIGFAREIGVSPNGWLRIPSVDFKCFLG
jgi:hypothetical protein